MTDNPFYAYTPIVERPVRPFPNGASVAVWLGVNLEHYEYGAPALSLAPFTASLVPDPLNHGWRDYGPRVGVWRLVTVFDELGLRPTAIVNSDVCDLHPAIIDAGVERGWAWVGHGRNNSTWQTDMEPAAERTYIAEVADRLETATGVRPRGWLGPALTSSAATIKLLAELGFRYTLDWGADDLPFRFDRAGVDMISVPYSTELNDIPFYVLHGQAGADFRQALVDQFDQLRAEGADCPRVMGIGIHPFLSGQPFRARYLREALEHMAAHDDVWFATADEIADWYLEAERPVP